jgi:hypothetical protein
MPDEPIKYRSDRQINWESAIEPLKNGSYTVHDTNILSIAGEAPKSFIRVKEYARGHTNTSRRWVGYIAKVGSKYYPLESVTEQMLTRIGQILGANIADSKLRRVGRQVRFLSKYFLSPRESLVHGIEIFKHHLDDDEFVEQVAKARAELEIYTFQTATAAVKERFPEYAEAILQGMVEMLAFDALIGHNDRHPANWGVVVPVTKTGVPRFSPIFDTARALFWNRPESDVVKILADKTALEGYIDRSKVKIGWDNCKKPGHFDIVGRIAAECPEFRAAAGKFASWDKLATCFDMIDIEFGRTLSQPRRTLIKECLTRRYDRYCKAIS